MRQLLRRRPSPSLLVAVAAVVVAGTGSAVAATAITTKQIKNGTIQLVDLNKATRAALQGGRGPQGPVGPGGANGAAGAPGGPGPAGQAGGDAITTTTGITTLTGNMDVMSLTLPAGTWFVASHVGGAYNGTTVSARIECAIVEPGNSDGDFSKLRVPPNTSSVDSLVFVDINMHAVVTLAAPTTVRTNCGVVQSAFSFTLTTHRMTAVRATSVARQ